MSPRIPYSDFKFSDPRVQGNIFRMLGHTPGTVESWLAVGTGHITSLSICHFHRELVILAVNTFVKDSDDPNPLVRALAIRTMGCLRAEKIIDYLCDPLQKCLRDENPYVRKTAALCVAKLYELKPELVLDNGFLEQLQEMVADSNPMVSDRLFSLPWMNNNILFCVFFSFCIYDRLGLSGYGTNRTESKSKSNLTNTNLFLMGLERNHRYIVGI